MPRYRSYNLKGEVIKQDPDPTQDGPYRRVVGYQARVQKAMADYTEQVRKIGLSARTSIRVFSPQGIAEAKQRQDVAIKAARQQLADTIKGLQAELQTDVDAAKKDMAVYLAPDPPKDTNESLLREIQEQRAWQRVRSLLDGTDTFSIGPALQKIADAAAQSGDETTLRALRAEMPSFLQARKENVPVYMKMLDTAEAAAEPWKEAVFAASESLDKGAYRVGLGLNYALYAVEKGQSDFMLPGFTESDGVASVAIDESYAFTGE